MVLIVEALTAEFAERFWQFIEDGRYRNKATSTEKPQFYRFDKPNNILFPKMVELFARTGFELKEMNGLTPIHIEDEVSGLSGSPAEKRIWNACRQQRYQKAQK